MSTDMTSAQAKTDDNGSTPRKYLFDRSFDSEVALTRPERKPEKYIFTPEQLESTKLQSYETGFKTAQQQMEDSLQKHANALLGQIGQRVAELIESNQDMRKEYLAHAQSLALAVTRKLFPSLTNRQGLEEIEALVAQTFTEMAHEPRLVIRVSESQFDSLSERIKTIAEQKAYAGKVVVLCEDGLGPSDCRIEWADGGIERDLGALWQTIERLTGNTCSFIPAPSDAAPVPNPASIANEGESPAKPQVSSGETL